MERGLRDVAKNKMDNLLQSHPQLAAVFGSNDDCALGALASVRAAGRSDVLIVGFDATPEARSAIEEGSQLKADAIQYPEVIGRRTIETIYRALHGEPVPPLVAVPVGIVDRDSLSRPAGRGTLEAALVGNCASEPTLDSLDRGARSSGLRSDPSNLTRLRPA